ncbi:MAG: Fur family transcriptional regulator [Candidatus Bathyarchaeia archaeon]|jgi:Fur family peroxide stress response transcriptional regulator
MLKGNKTDIVIIQALRSKGYKATPQRIAVCRTALNTKEHPNVEKVYNEVKKTYPTVSLATVYKTLHILKENQLIQELNMPQGETRFDPNTTPHVNLVCKKCGKIQDFSHIDLKTHIKNVIADTKFCADTVRVDVYGLCESCAKKHSNP